MADGLFYLDQREPFIAADVAAVTLASTFKALYPAANFPILGGQYFARPGRRLKIRAFGRITTGATPGNFQFGVYYGTGGDANGVQLAASTAQALTAGQTNLSWEAEVNVHCRSTGATGTLFATGRILFAEGVCAPHILLPGSAPVVSGSCDLTAANILSVQANRSWFDRRDDASARS
jgi:hypothetical protein